MRISFILLFLFFALSSYSQSKSSLRKSSAQKDCEVSFITRFDIKNATKDGFYLNGYVVNIAYEKGERLNGKTIKVSGKVTIIKAIKSQPGKEIRQGRERDSKHIDKPFIKIVND